jgi:hypothetical protein
MYRVTFLVIVFLFSQFFLYFSHLLFNAILPVLQIREQEEEARKKKEKLHKKTKIININYYNFDGWYQKNKIISFFFF